VEPAIFLDRDNTLIANDGDLGDPNDVHLMDGVADGLRRLREAGYRLIVVTNQGGVARGAYTEDDVDAVHQEIARQIDEQAGEHRLIDRFYYCPYHPEATVETYRRDHPWRKPHPGMILQATRDLDLDLERSWLIGDKPRDVQAGAAAGCRTVLVNGKAGSPTDTNDDSAAAHVTTFDQAVDIVMRETQRTTTVDQPHTDAVSEPIEQPPWFGKPTDVVHTKPASDGSKRATDENALQQAVRELTEEVRARRIERSEFTGFRLTAILCQVLVIVLVMLGLLQLDTTDIFFKWMAVALIAQLVTITLLLLDLR